MCLGAVTKQNNMVAIRQYLSSWLLGRKRKIFENLVTSRRSKYLLLESNDCLATFWSAMSVVCAMKCEKKMKSPNEERNHSWWEHGYQNWTDAQFKKRFRVSQDMFQFMLDEIADDIRKETTRFKNPTSPELQLALTFYRLSHGCTYATVGDLFGVATSTACTIFLVVTKVIVCKLYDKFIVLPENDEEWKAELTSFLEDWEFPCVGAWDGFHVYINCQLRNFYSFKKCCSITNMGLVAANKRFLWAGVGAPGSMHDSTILQSSDIFNSIERGHVLPNQVLKLPEYGKVPFVTVGDSAFPPRSWLLKAFTVPTKDAKEKRFNNKSRTARVVSEHAYGMLKGRWRIIYKKTECRRRNIKVIIMACIVLHNICIARNDPCNPRWKLEVNKLHLIRKATKRTKNKRLVQEIRNRIAEWLWSLY